MTLMTSCHEASMGMLWLNDCLAVIEACHGEEFLDQTTPTGLGTRQGWELARRG